MKLTREEALRLHREMWTDMQRDLGDNDIYSRSDYKAEWCEKYFPNEEISSNCFLCEYDDQNGSDCWHCPIDWPHDEEGCPNCCEIVGTYPYYIATPISEILALPERKVEDGISDN